eukprot:172752-Chlamydomonas_euryale.AAC.2
MLDIKKSQVVCIYASACMHVCQPACMRSCLPMCMQRRMHARMCASVLPCISTHVNNKSLKLGCPLSCPFWCVLDVTCAVAADTLTRATREQRGGPAGDVHSLRLRLTCTFHPRSVFPFRRVGSVHGSAVALNITPGCQPCTPIRILSDGLDLSGAARFVRFEQAAAAALPSAPLAQPPAPPFPSCSSPYLFLKLRGVPRKASPCCLIPSRWTRPMWCTLRTPSLPRTNTRPPRWSPAAAPRAAASGR